MSLPSASNEISYTVYLRDSPKPSGGYPVVIFGHGLATAAWAAPPRWPDLRPGGLATLAITAVGPATAPKAPSSWSTAAATAWGARRGSRYGSRRRRQDRRQRGLHPAYRRRQHARLPAPDRARPVAAHTRRALRHRRDGDGSADLDSSSIFYTGESLETLYGTIFHA